MAGLPIDRGREDRRVEAILNHESSDWRKETAVGLSCLLDTRVYMTNQLLRDSDASEHGAFAGASRAVGRPGPG